MSLDVYLTGNKPIERPVSSGIFVRENGKTVEISRDEWDKRNPGREPVIFKTDKYESLEIYHDNITHNMVAMAKEAGLEFMWDARFTIAGTLIEPLDKGLARLLTKPDEFKKLNPTNGWGSYEQLVQFTTDYLAACRANPDANVEVSI